MIWGKEEETHPRTNKTDGQVWTSKMEGNSGEGEAAVTALKKDPGGAGDRASSSAWFGSKPLWLPLGLTVLFSGDGPEHVPQRPHLAPTLSVQGCVLRLPCDDQGQASRQWLHQPGQAIKEPNTAPSCWQPSAISNYTSLPGQHNAPQSSRPWCVLLPTLRASSLQIHMLPIRGTPSHVAESGLAVIRVALLDGRAGCTYKTLL